MKCVIWALFTLEPSMPSEWSLKLAVTQYAFIKCVYFFDAYNYEALDLKVPV